MKVIPYKKRRNVEIYFVLYLAALILLIPGKESDKTAQTDEFGSPLYQLDFNLKAEKSTLNYVFFVDSLGIHLENADSVNYIFHTGDVEDVRYEFIVEDLLRRNKAFRKNIKITSINIVFKSISSCLSTNCYYHLLLSKTFHIENAFITITRNFKSLIIV